MKEKKCYKNRMAAVFPLLFAVVLCTACHPTPEETVVEGKNSDEFYEKILIKNNGTNSYEYDDYYDEFISKDNKVTMQIDAKIITPATTKLPVITFQ